MAAIIAIHGTPTAVVLVGDEQTYPEPAAALIQDVQRYFPTMGVMLIAPRVGGFSRTWAHWDTASLGRELDTRTIAWAEYREPPEAAVPF